MLRRTSEDLLSKIRRFERQGAADAVCTPGSAPLRRCRNGTARPSGGALLDISLPSGEAREAVPCMLKDRTTWSVGHYHAKVLPTNVTSGGRGRDGSADQVLEIRLQTSENAAEATRDVDLARPIRSRISTWVRPS
jgi:hypothetical protein